MNNVDLKTVIALTKTYNLFLHKISSQLSIYELNVSEFGVLELLYHKGPQQVQKIAEKILVSSGTMTYVVNQLIKKGFVIRRRCVNDQRIYYVELTELGQEKIEFVFPRHQAYLASLFSGITEEDQVHLVELLKKTQISINDFGDKVND